MTAIIVQARETCVYKAYVYDGDKLVDVLVECDVVKLRKRVKKVYGIDCE